MIQIENLTKSGLLFFLIGFSLISMQSCAHSIMDHYSADIKKTFGNTKFKEIIVPNEHRSSKTSNFIIVKFETKNEKFPKNIVYLLMDEEGKVGGLFIGSEKFTNSDQANMTKGDFCAKIWMCIQEGNTAAGIKECAQEVYLEALMECATSDNCEVDCWMNGGECFD